MGKKPIISREELNRRSWTAEEDKILSDYIRTHGETGWRSLPQKAGLNRCGKSCRLRWLNYLRPDIKRGNISPDEEELIVRMHRLLGNRWALIAGRLPGRTDNEIKNYWNTRLSKKLAKRKCPPSADPSEDRPTKPCEIMRSMCGEKEALDVSQISFMEDPADASSIQLKNGCISEPGYFQTQPENGSLDSLESIVSALSGIPYPLDCNLFSMPCTDFGAQDLSMEGLLPHIAFDLQYNNFII
ncbi:hypothetical protein SUGI_0171640 [Cryptomeria japonica]|uniref:transcription factor MYB8 n=1 Tax=Cryptomeria japonica TaxID=3369 RepID=UPI002408D2ED|nr:transcription factor MYB8 [Cryptomeria japonica]GLJ11573.1 hypothetical protein SUGI_0171640 [Cryptomeria japonica]